MQMPSRNTVVLSLVFVSTLTIDLLTKTWVIDRIHYGERWVVIPGFFNLTHVRNPGGAFSFLASMSGEIRQVFFLATGVLAIGLLLTFFRRLGPDQTLSSAAIGAVLGGAIGNLSNRIVYGEVIDFLDFRLWGGYVWPTFNIADSCIVVGVTILMIEMFFEPDLEESDSSDDGETDTTLPTDAQDPSTS